MFVLVWAPCVVFRPFPWSREWLDVQRGCEILKGEWCTRSYEKLSKGVVRCCPKSCWAGLPWFEAGALSLVQWVSWGGCHVQIFIVSFLGWVGSGSGRVLGITVLEKEWCYGSCGLNPLLTRLDVLFLFGVTVMKLFSKWCFALAAPCASALALVLSFSVTWDSRLISTEGQRVSRNSTLPRNWMCWSSGHDYTSVLQGGGLERESELSGMLCWQKNTKQCTIEGNNRNIKTIIPIHKITLCNSLWL